VFINARSWLIAVLPFLLAGCAGTNFVRPDPDSLKNGQMKYSEILDRFGAPRREGSLVKNDKNVKTITYSYASTVGTTRREGVVPARGLTFLFLDEVLVGHEFISSWREDHTDFDGGRINQITKGQTNRTEVVALLGKPSGYYIYPLIAPTTGEAVVYSYAELMQSEAELKRVRKVLIVTFDPRGIVIDINYSASGDQPRQ